jgi:hypothetical protein
MARTPQIRRTGGGIGQRTDRGGAVVDRDAGGATRHGEGSPQQRSVVLLHHVQFQLLAARLRKRCAEHAAAVGEHEIDDFGGDFLGGDDEIALVFAVFVVDDDHDPALAEILDSLFDRIENSVLSHNLHSYFIYSLRVCV